MKDKIKVMLTEKEKDELLKILGKEWREHICSTYDDKRKAIWKLIYIIENELEIDRIE
jgi:hypothetical protein